MKQTDKEFINYVKANYLKAKHVLGIISNADDMSYDVYLIKKSTTIEQIELLEDFVSDLEDKGIQSLFPIN